MTRRPLTVIALLIGAAALGALALRTRWGQDAVPNRAEAEAHWQALVTRAALSSTRHPPLPTAAGASAERDLAIASAAERGDGAFFASDAESAAIRALVAWAEADGDLGLELCEGLAFDPVSPLRAARLALATAEADPSDRNYVAVAHLGARLVSRGRSLHAVVGLTILEHLLDRAARDALPVGAWRWDLEDALPGVLAREHLCAHSYYAEHGPPPNLPDLDAPERELLAYRAFFGAEVAALTARTDDDALLARARLAPPEARPAGAWVRSVPSDAHQLTIETFVRVRRAWRAAAVQEPSRQRLWAARRWLTAQSLATGQRPAALPGEHAGLALRPAAAGLELADGDVILAVPDPPPPGEPVHLHTATEPEVHGRDTTLRAHRDEVQAILQSPARLAGQGRWVAHTDEAVRGWMLRGARPFGLYRQLGLRDGDVVVEVDGHPLGDPAQDRAYVEAALTAGTLTLTYRRDGRPHTLALEVEAAAE